MLTNKRLALFMKKVKCVLFSQLRSIILRLFVSEKRVSTCSVILQGTVQGHVVDEVFLICISVH